jgi:hypothetical protein
VSSGGVKTKLSDGIASKWLNDSEAVHIFVHTVEVPQSYVIVQTSSGHPMSFRFHHAASHSFVMTIQRGKGFDGNSQLMPRLVAVLPPRFFSSLA